MWEYEDVLYATKQVIFRIYVPPNSRDETHDDALLQSTWSWMEKLPTGKRKRDSCVGQQPSRSLSPQVITVATVRSQATVTKGEVGSVSVEIMFDSGSAVSLLRKRDMDQMEFVQQLRIDPKVKLITASGEPLPIVDHVQVGSLKVAHDFVVVDSLIYPVILGIDFLQVNEVGLDFTSVPISVQHRGPNNTQQLKAVWDSEKDAKTKRCAVAIIKDPSANMIDECSVPKYGDPLKFDLPCSTDPEIGLLLKEYKNLFGTIPGATTLAHYHIPTSGNPVRVPPRRVPAHFKEEVEC